MPTRALVAEIAANTHIVSKGNVKPASVRRALADNSIVLDERATDSA